MRTKNELVMVVMKPINSFSNSKVVYVGLLSE